MRVLYDVIAPLNINAFKGDAVVVLGKMLCEHTHTHSESKREQERARVKERARGSLSRMRERVRE